MRRTAYRFLAASSVLALAMGSVAAERPHYGGTVRVAERQAPTSVDPGVLNSADDTHILPLMVEGLTRFDSQGSLQPQLATKWQADGQNQRWQFWLRHGVKFHDGSPLTAELVAASLRAANRTWTVTALEDSVTIQTEISSPTIAAELALPRNAIVRHLGDKIAGTGPFQIAEWQAGKKLVLAAYDDYWGGRPFADSVEVTLGQSWRQQLIALDLGKADVVELAPEQIRRVISDGRKVSQSAGKELVALVFTREPQSTEEAQLRQALSTAIDRSSIVNVFLQAQGEPAFSILPNWMSGYAFLFGQNAEGSKKPAAQARGTLTVFYDNTDPVNQLIAERVALNARDAGIAMQSAPSAVLADVRLLRIRLQSPDSQVALTYAASAVGLSPPKFQGSSPDELYAREREMLQSGRIIPLLHVPVAAVVAPNLNGWRTDPFGAWKLQDVWLSAGKP